MKEARIVYHSAKDIRNDPRFKPGCSLRVKDKGIVYPYEAISQSPAVDLLVDNYEFVDIIPSPDPKTIVKYVNIYKCIDGTLRTGNAHSTVESAKEAAERAKEAYSECVGRVKLTGTEGVFEE